MSEPRQLNNDELFEAAKDVLARRVWSDEAENVFREVLNRLDYHIAMQKFRSQQLPKRAVRRERERIIALLEAAPMTEKGYLAGDGEFYVRQLDRDDYIALIKGEE